jgi:hypothetical protein
MEVVLPSSETPPPNRWKDSSAAVLETGRAIGAVLEVSGASRIGTCVGELPDVLELLAQFDVRVGGVDAKDRAYLMKVCVYDGDTGKINLRIFVKAVLASLKIAKKILPKIAPIGHACLCFKIATVAIGAVETALCVKKLKEGGCKKGEMLRFAVAASFPIWSGIISSVGYVALGPMVGILASLLIFLIRAKYTGRDLEKVTRTTTPIRGIYADLRKCAAKAQPKGECPDSAKGICNSPSMTARELRERRADDANDAICKILVAISAIGRSLGCDFPKWLLTPLSRCLAKGSLLGGVFIAYVRGRLRVEVVRGEFHRGTIRLSNAEMPIAAA